MNTIIRLCLMLLFVMSLASCDKVDDNGNLGGMWQLTEWKNVSDGSIMATKTDAIFYSVQLDLMKFSRNNDISTYHLARFSHKGDSLFVLKAYSRPLDQEVPLGELSKYGVPATGAFAVDKLSSREMVLRSKESVLRFRKY